VYDVVEDVKAAEIPVLFVADPSVRSPTYLSGEASISKKGSDRS
jgi:hypothetical protein